MNNKKPVVLTILDGWGEWDIKKGNAIREAKLKTFKELDSFYPKTYLQASGMSVGLPWGIRGNSEVGHQTIGSGQIIFQFLPAITTSITDGSFFENKVLKKAFSQGKKKNSNLHIWGLLSDGGVHSHIDHLFALIDMAVSEGLKQVYLHIITDGRDTHPKSAKKYIKRLEDKISSEGVGKIATISGRYYSMDRNNNWDRIEKSFLAMTAGKGRESFGPLEAVDEQYDNGIKDEYLEPVVIKDDSGQPVGKIKKGDAVLCFNFRKDRSRQLTRAFSVQGFSEFKQAEPIKDLNCYCFAEYEKGLPVEVAFSIKKITSRLGQILSEKDKKQLRIAETEKYAHVTYFFNGGVEKPFSGEDRTVVPSKRVQTYAEIPEMSAPEVMDKLMAALDDNKYDFILVNFANPDMVGHTGVLEAGIKAVEHIDEQVGKLIKKVLEKNGHMIITADHGNVEEMVNVHNGEVDTKHSKNPVPCWYVSPEARFPEEISGGRDMEIRGMLIDLAPTVLDIMGIEKPADMIGISLLEVFGDQK